MALRRSQIYQVNTPPPKLPKRDYPKLYDYIPPKDENKMKIENEKIVKKFKFYLCGLTG